MVGTSSDPGSAFVFNSDPDSDDALRHNAILAAAATDDSAYDFDSGFPSAFNSDSTLHLCLRSLQFVYLAFGNLLVFFCSYSYSNSNSNELGCKKTKHRILLSGFVIQKNLATTPKKENRRN